MNLWTSATIAADERAGGDRAAHIARDWLSLYRNHLTFVPAEIGQLTALKVTLQLLDSAIG